MRLFSTPPLLRLTALAGCAVLTQQAPAFNLGSLVYEPVEPCRLVDTRNSVGGNLVNGTAQSFIAYGSAAELNDQNSNAIDCPNPRAAEGVMPVAASVNVSAVGNKATANGNLRAWATGQAQPATAILSYQPGTNISNNATVPLCHDDTCTGGHFDLLSSAADVPATVDVEGYFYPRNPQNEIVVSPAGADFAYLSDAIAFLQNLVDTADPDAPAEDNPWTIHVATGRYIEDSSITLIPWVSIIGPGRSCEASVTVTDGSALFADSAASTHSLSNICFATTSATSAAALYATGGAEVFLVGVSLISSANDGAALEVLSGAKVAGTHVDLSASGAAGRVIALTDGTSLTLEDSHIVASISSGVGAYGIDAVDATLNLTSTDITVEATNGTLRGMRLRNGAALVATGIKLGVGHTQSSGSTAAGILVESGAKALLSQSLLAVTANNSGAHDACVLCVESGGTAQVSGGALGLTASAADAGSRVVQQGGTTLISNSTVEAHNGTNNLTAIEVTLDSDYFLLANSSVAGIVTLAADSNAALVNNYVAFGQSGVVDNDPDNVNCRGNYGGATLSVPNDASGATPAAAEYTPGPGPRNNANFFGEVGC